MQWGEDDLSVFPSTKPNSADFKTTFMKFVCLNKKYKEYLDSNNDVFYSDSYKDLPDDLNECEKLFDKDVLKIEKLVQEIGALSEVVEDE